MTRGKNKVNLYQIGEVQNNEKTSKEKVVGTSHIGEWKKCSYDACQSTVEPPSAIIRWCTADRLRCLA